MLDLTALSSQRYYVVGLGLSGASTARALRSAGIAIQVWDDVQVPEDLQDLAVAPEALDFGPINAVILSPGIPLTHPTPHRVVGLAQAAGVEIIGDIEVAFRAGIRAKTIGITGTNGKSTTTALVHHTLEAMGKRSVIGGNFGRPLLAEQDPGADGFMVLELSSYQLDLSRGYPLDAACLLNISPDHLERHGDLQGYADAKARIFNATAHGFVLGTDAQSLAIAQTSGARTITPEDAAEFAETPALRGAHNQQNQAAACAMLEALGFARADIVTAMQSFGGVAHRQEILGSAKGWTFVNDSKATNVDSAVRALSAFTNIHWLAGGQGKAGGLEDLGPGLVNVTHAYLYGENRRDLAELCTSKGVACTQFDTLDQAFAAAIAQSGGTMLLAPASASWDQYKSFEVRGDHFRALTDPYLKDMAA